MEPILDRSLFHQPYGRRGRSRLRNTLTTFAAFIVFIPIAVGVLYFFSSPLSTLTAAKNRAAAAVATSPSLVERSVAAASAQLSGLDAAADSVYRWLCPYIGTCGEEAQLAPASPARPLAPISAPAVAVATTTPAAPKYVSLPPQQTIINQPVIERIVEREVAAPQEGAVPYSLFETRLQQLEQTFNGRLAANAASASATFVSAPVFAHSNRIDSLANVSISNPTITGGSIEASSITGTITNAIEAALATLDELTATDATFTRATTTNLVAINATSTNFAATSATLTNATTTSLAVTGSATTSFSGGILATRLSATATSTLSGLVIDGAGLRFSTLDCSSYGNEGTLTTDASGFVVCASDDGGAGSTVGGSNMYVQFNNNGSFAGDAGFTYASSSDLLTVTNASTTNITTSYASTSALVTSNSFTFKNVTGFLKATAGAVATALIDLASDVTGTLPITSGGTGTSTPASYGNVLAWNGSNWQGYATSTLGLPLYSDLEDYLALSSWYATTTDALDEGASNLYFTTNRVAGVLAGTTTDAIAEGATNKYYSTLLFSGSLAGTTTDALAEGGTNRYYTDARVGSYISGSTTIPHVGGSAYGDLLSWTGTAWTTSATSTLAINTDDTAEGSTNLFFTSARARSALSVSSPLTYNSGTGAFGFDFSTTNTWTGLNVFSQASSTRLSIFDRLYVGGTATTTILGSATSTFGAGIQTTALDVTGSATSTFAAGVKLSGGCFEMPNGSCLSTSSGSGTVGSGTTGQFSYYAADGTTLTATSSIYLATTGNVGIGTASPGAALDVNGAVRTSFLTATSSGSSIFNIISSNSNGPYGTFYTGGTAFGDIGAGAQLMSGGSGSTDFGLNTRSGHLVFGTSNVERMRITSTGNVGIGTTSPSTLLHLYNSSAAIEQRLDRGQTLSNGDTIASVTGYGGSSTGVSRKYGALDIIASTTTNGSEEGKVQVSWRNGANTEAALFNPYGLILQNATHNSTLDMYFDNGRGIVMRSPDQDNSGGPFGGNNWYTLSLSSSNQLDLQAPTSGQIRFFIGTAGSGGQKAVIDSSGNFGIGTTTPQARLSVVDNGYTGSSLFNVVADDSNPWQFNIYNTAYSWTNPFRILLDTTGSARFYNGGSQRMTIDASGNVGIGTTNPGRPLVVSSSAGELVELQDSANSGNAAIAYIEFIDSGGTRTGYVGDADGNSKNLVLVSNGGDLRIYGTGGNCILTGAASGGSCFSDVRLKTVQGEVTDTLDKLSTLDLKTFYWNDLAASTTNASTTILQYGFLAQDVEKVFPELVHEEDVYKSLDYGTLGMYAIQGLKELNTKVDGLDLKLAGLTSSTPQESKQGFVQTFFDNVFAKVGEWLANAANNIVVIIADTLTARDQLCIGSTCVTESQLQAMLANATEAANSGSGQHEHSPSVTPDTEPPAITVNGNNPATLSVGDTYSDLGAAVSDNVDQNLGIKTYLNGLLVSDIMLDTSSPATYTIDYVATDNVGNAATSSRTVIIEAPSLVPSDAPIEEPEGEQENQDEPTIEPLPAEL